MTQLIKIGNSQGIRISKSLIEHAGLQDTELHLQVVDEGLLISPVKKNRAGWAEAIQAAQKTNQKDPALDPQWLNAKLTSDKDQTW